MLMMMMRSTHALDCVLPAILEHVDDAPLCGKPRKTSTQVTSHKSQVTKEKVGVLLPLAVLVVQSTWYLVYSGRRHRRAMTKRDLLRCQIDLKFGPRSWTVAWRID